MKQSAINRRKFLRMTATAGVGATFFSEGASAAVAGMRTESVLQEKIEMPVRTLGRTGLKLPILSMGVMKADNPSVLRAAYNSGIIHYDTANGYQNGRNEEMIGTFFADKPRESFIVATKAKFNYPLRESFETDLMGLIDTSLARLKMKSVDIFYMHDYRSVEMMSDERVLAMVKKIKETGKARFVGFSSHANNPELLNEAAKLGVYDVILLTYNFKLNNLDDTNAAIERAANAGIGLVAMKTLTGAVEDAEGNKKVNARACLKWVWQNKNITTIIPGFTNYDELDECIAAVKSPDINENEKKYLVSLRNNEMMFCQQCNQCNGQCPENLPIPDIMRAYMYAFGYKQSQLSKETLAELNLPEDICSKCTDGCSVKCPSGFKIGNKIAAVRPVMNVPDVFLT